MSVNNHGHDHGHNHKHVHTNNKKVLLISFIIITVYMIIEAVGGVITNSLALLSDAGHMLSDSIALGVALLAFTFGSKAVNTGKTYGYRRFEILAAALNGVTLIGISLYIFYEAIERFMNPPEVATFGMLIISTIGLLINLLVAWIMMRGSDTKENLNMRSAYLHVLSDMLGSVGAIAAALMMMFFGLGWADPLASVVVAGLVLRSGYFVTKSSLHVLMEGTPENVDMNEIVNSIRRIDGVKGVHDVHIWSITSSMNALTAHVVVNGEKSIYETEVILKKIKHMLEHKEIWHVTLQVMSSERHAHDSSILCTVKADVTDAHAHHHH
ncbi:MULTISPECIES: cation diffusion facilitator family transporter [Paenibacillus]|uniref:Cation transporter n=3 Tax=Paenibacillus TaxID=44249 RepID=A0ABX2ZK12_PAEPO|nr:MULTISPECIES: cation diffusion facilitator family transporter [Paenibacillus]AIW40113.1 cation transporter [Paenibacillus polymyxa CR1]APB75898.1 cation transporter [Paenibacillus polymyxa]APQ59555.1 cation transporter [Paenibacillus polymyxa]MDR6775922.1 cobalt-zinc-cadmium efflux system protein [Paenibacillus peoriae]ODA11137.1 cation transporter [Paenibacillus polymyxa]